jgi:uncharacterized membrane protein
MTLPPIHPALVHLPIAFVLLSFAADVVALITRRRSLRHVGWWAMVAALGTGALAIAAGYWDLSRVALSPETRDYAELHMKFGWALGLSLSVLTIWRWRIRQQARRTVTKPYALAALLVFALTIFQGWFGGELVYAHGAGVAAAGQGTEHPDKAQQRLARVREWFAPDVAVGAPGTNAAAQRGEAAR